MLLVSAHSLLFPNQMWCDFKGWGGSILTDVWKGRLACFFRREGRIKVGGDPQAAAVVAGMLMWISKGHTRAPTHWHVHAQSCPTLRPNGLDPTRPLRPWDFPGKNTGVGCCFLLQGIFPGQGSNPCLLHCRRILYHSVTWEVTGPPFTIIEKEKLDLWRGGRVRCTFGPMNQVLQTPS